MASLHVIRPGLQTTVQDRGRWGLQSRGVPTAGPMDPCAHRLANLLAGNDADAATLEITIVGPELEFDDERVVAVAGAEFVLSVDGRSRPMHQPFTVPTGSRLRFGERRSGARAYLAVAGGVVVPPILGSRSTHLVSGMGGIDGRAAVAGDRLPLGIPHGAPHAMMQPGRIPRLPEAGQATTIRVMAGPHHDRFAAGALDALQSAPYVIRPESDRMGFRLEGPPIEHTGSADIISDATPLGVLQVPASRQPVLLMADRQTTGGYPHIATVIAADIGLAGQLAPGDLVRFELCTLDVALAALIHQEQALMAVDAGPPA
jgi:antagonist of KipI